MHLKILKSRSKKKITLQTFCFFTMNSFSGDVSRKWTDVARQCRRWCCQFAASNVLSTVRGVACGCWLALHAAAAASATATATSATSAVTSVTSALALRRPDLHDMLFESLGVLRAIACKARPSSWSHLWLSAPILSVVVFDRLFLQKVLYT